MLAAAVPLTSALSSASADPAAPAEPAAAEFQQVSLASGNAEMGEPMSLAVLPDRSVLHTARDGTVRLTTSEGATSVAGRLTVYDHDEEGLQGIAVDPNFAANRWVYLFYAPPLDTPAGDAPEFGSAADFASFEGVNRLSRFVLNEDGTLDLGSEISMLEVTTSRGQCCHVGGDIDFDAQGNLYLSTGDDTNPFASDGYTPIDERGDRNPAFDAQRSSGNTNDLRGKVLRITPQADGSYTTPEGNLFPPGTEGTRPEIYAMGFRNPFRMSVDDATGVVYLGDYGPDAGGPSDTRGPGGQVEFNRITEPGNFGWPYCTGDNDAYVDYDFGSGASGGTFDCGAPRNTSRNNTGLTDLPPAQPAWIPYDGNSVPEFGNGSESPMGGPVYNYDPDLQSDVKFPQEYDGDYFAGEYGRQWIKRVEMDGSGGVTAINDFPWTGTQVMDMTFGPDGALYVLDYGIGGQDVAGLYRVEYTSGGLAPIARAAADTTSGTAPLAVGFSSEGSSDPGGSALGYAWDFGDGGTSTDANPTHTYETNGQYTAELTVTNGAGLTANASIPVTVGNTAPTVQLNLPHNGQLVDFGDAVPFEITVTDPEESEIDCANVTLTFALGHDNHHHDLTSTTGCSGTLQTLSDGEHDANANIYGVFRAEYTDGGANGQPPLTGVTERVSQPTHRQGEHFGNSSGVEVVDQASAHGGHATGFISGGDWISYHPYHLADAGEFTARVASAGAGGTIEVRAGAPDGTLLGSVEVPVTGGWETYQDVTTTLSNQPAETTELYLVFTGPTGAGDLFNVDDFILTPSPTSTLSPTPSSTPTTTPTSAEGE
ncbi:PQQ-dependent sugar dehydrogenase [Streptomyces sp. B6B3]|uniref:PQQ-dependent sugar dehydrogenase n=1 Tax=Streptomyces sp. B6B3 TaxID=3153570 RepID=UPI00325F3F5E